MKFCTLTTMDEIDQLLASLHPSPPPPASRPSPPAANFSTRSIEDLLSQIDVSETRTARSAAPPQPLVEEIKTENLQQQAEVARQVELDRQQKQQRREQLKQQRRAELAAQAEQWLKSLQPKSSEGRWFEEFACHYSSRLEAAIDYLEALQDITPSSD